MSCGGVSSAASLLLAAAAGASLLSSCRHLSPDQFHAFGSQGWGTSAGGVDRGVGADTYADQESYAVTVGFSWDLPQPGDDDPWRPPDRGLYGDSGYWDPYQPRDPESEEGEPEAPEESEGGGAALSQGTIDILGGIFAALIMALLGLAKSRTAEE